MASPCKKSTHLHSKLFYYMLLFMWIINAQATEIQVEGEVGGNVSIYCPINTQRKIKYFYLQKVVNGKQEVFVNGFHSENVITDTIKWNNTRLDPHNKTTVHMYNLTLKEAAIYKCHIDEYPATTVNLTVAAKYSKPAVAMRNVSKQGLCVTCKSYGGYPPAEIMWNVSGTGDWHVMTKHTKADKLTGLVNTSSMVFINCSGVERSISCSVADSASDIVQVCQPTPAGDSTLIIAVCVSVGVVLLVLLVCAPLVCIMKKKGKFGGCAGDGGEGGHGKEQEVEMKPLNTPANGNA